MSIGGFLFASLATAVGNCLTFLIYTAVVNTGWFKSLEVRLTKDLNIIGNDIGKNI